MYTIQNNTVIPVACKDIVSIGAVVDHRIEAIETLVANFYGKTVNGVLDVWYHTSDEKLMCCFLLHDLLNYSFGSIGNRYRIYPGFLRNKINEYYIKCLQDADFMCQVTAMRTAFLEGKETAQTDERVLG